MNNPQKEFLDFHNSNPEIYGLYLKYAKMHPTAAGKTINGITEAIRWNEYFPYSNREFKIKNSYRAGYARLLMWRNFKMRDKFKLCKSSLDGNLANPKNMNTWDNSYWNSFK